MKNALIVMAAAAILVGCDSEKGGSTSGDIEYGSGRGQSDTLILTNDPDATRQSSGKTPGTSSLTNEMKNPQPLPPGSSTLTNELRNAPPPSSGQAPQGPSAPQGGASQGSQPQGSSSQQGQQNAQQPAQQP